MKARLYYFLTLPRVEGCGFCCVLKMEISSGFNGFLSSCLKLLLFTPTVDQGRQVALLQSRAIVVKLEAQQVREWRRLAASGDR